VQESAEQKRERVAAAQAVHAEQARQQREKAGASYVDAEWIQTSEREQLELLEAEQALAAQQAAAEVSLVP
jgi:hypothetical protein